MDENSVFFHIFMQGKRTLAFRLKSTARKKIKTNKKNANSQTCNCLQCYFFATVRFRQVAKKALPMESDQSIKLEKGLYIVNTA